MYSVGDAVCDALIQDDLASEGLLLIRMKPDERGRYGFNIKVHWRYMYMHILRGSLKWTIYHYDVMGGKGRR